MSDLPITGLTAVTSVDDDDLLEVVVAVATTPVNRKVTKSDLFKDVATKLLESNAQTGTSYTFVITDLAKVVSGNNGSDIDFTMPPNSDVAFPVGAVIEVYQKGAGQITMVEGAGVDFVARNGTKTAGQGAVLALWQESADIWVITGDVTT